MREGVWNIFLATGSIRAYLTYRMLEDTEGIIKQ